MITNADNIIKRIKTTVDIDSGEKIDYIVAGEIVEHLENPVDFLKEINRIYSGYVRRIVVTVPNILYYQYMLWALKSLEHNNTDHKYWFTPYTISKVLTCAGMRVSEILFVGNRHSLIQRMIHAFLRNNMIISVSLICIADLQESTTD